MYVVLLINVNIKLNTRNLHVYYAGRRKGGLFLTPSHCIRCKQLRLSRLCLQSPCQWFDFQQMWQWPLQWSALSFELSEEQRRKKNSTQHLLGCSLRESLDKKLLFFSPVLLLINSVLVITGLSSCSAYDFWCVWQSHLKLVSKKTEKSVGLHRLT